MLLNYPSLKTSLAQLRSSGFALVGPLAPGDVRRLLLLLLVREDVRSPDMAITLQGRPFE